MKATITKKTEDSVVIEGISMRIETFLSHMWNLGFDPLIAQKNLATLNAGGQWELSINYRQLKYLYQKLKPTGW